MFENPAKKIVFILEHPEHLAEFRTLAKGMKAKLSVIATSPGVCWGLEQISIGFYPVERYYDGNSFFQTGMENYHRVEDICEKIDSHLQNSDPVLRKFHFRPAKDNFFSIKMLYDALTLRITILKRIIEDENPDLIVTFKGGKSSEETDAWEYLPFRLSESIYAELLALPGWSCPNLHIAISPAPIPFFNRTRAIISRLRVCMKRVETRKILSRAYHSFKHRVLGGPYVLQVGYGYNWDSVSHLINKEGLFMDKFRRIKKKRELPRKSLSSLPRDLLEPHGTFMGIDLSIPLLNHGNKVIEDYLQTYPDLVSLLQERFQRDPPVAVLFGTKSSSSDHIIAHITQHHHIPVISWQHGAQGAYYAPMMLYYEIMNSDLHLCFGEGVRELYDQDARQKFSCELRAAGSYELESLFLDHAPHDLEFDVLYATTNYYLNYLYIGGLSHTTFQDNDFWYTQKRILDLLAKSGRKIAFKLHPGQYQERHIREYLAGKGDATITVIRNERTFPDLALHAAMVILDCPSTTLLQSVAAKKPVFALTRHANLTEKAMSALGKRAYCTEDLDEFVSLIERYFREDPTLTHPDPADSEFLLLYGIHKADGAVAGRVISTLKSLRNTPR